MWSRSSWCERSILVSLWGLLLLLCYNIMIQQLLHTPWLLLHATIAILLSIWITCRDMQHLLEGPAPLSSLHNYPHMNLISLVISLLKRVLPVHVDECQDFGVDNRVKWMNSPLMSSDVSVMSSVVERRCVWPWYSAYVSKEVVFPFACKQMLDQIITKIVQVSYNVDTIGFYSDSLGIFLRHSKEYKRAKKRLTKIGQGSIEEYYRNTHPTSPQRNSLTTSLKGKSTQGHCLLLTRRFLKELLPWELWGTPQSLLLASVLAKRLDTYITTNLSNPLWLRNRIMKILNPTFFKENVDINDCENISLSDKDSEKGQTTPVQTTTNSTIDCTGSTTPEFKEHGVETIVDTDHSVVENNEDVVMKTSIESALSNLIPSSTAPILQRAEVDDSSSKNFLHVGDKNISKSSKQASQPISISSSPSHSMKSSSSNEVKIYDKVLDGSVKTWNSDNDLECVSLGHDLLASLDGDIETRFGRLWEADGVDVSESWSPNPPSIGSSTKTPHTLWFGEDDNLDIDLTDDSPPKHNNANNQHTTSTNTPSTTTSNAQHASNMVQNMSSHSITNFHISNPLSIHNMKELQNISKNTVNQAKHKIGDLQDEAAGVMEGILDFGIAGFKKGLRLTGLQESPTDKSPAVVPGKLPESMSTITSALEQVLSRKSSQSDENESAKDIANAIKDFEVIDGNKPTNNQQHLVKQQHVTSQDSSFFTSLAKEKDIAKDKEPIAEDPSPALFLDPVPPGADSPEYEYEETADFASTIAKLRHLLQEKTSDLTPKSQDDFNLPDSVHSQLISQSRPASSTQPTNSPIHRSSAAHPSNSVPATKSEEIVSSPSIDSDFGFTILSPNSGELVEAEEALNHKIEQISLSTVPQVCTVNNANNMQRLDKLFTRTVTGVFNTIKTAVGVDSLAEGVSTQPDMIQSINDRQTVVRAHQHKDDWIFVEGEMEVSKVVSKLLMERRGFCVVEVEVEAGQDPLEVLGGGTTRDTARKGHSTPTLPCVNDDLDESEVILGCPLYQMCMELVSVILGGVLQKDAVVKCTSVIVADMVERILQNKLNNFNSWLATLIIESFHQLSAESAKSSEDVDSVQESQQTMSVAVDELCDALVAVIPDILFTVLGKQELTEALSTLISSIEHPLINRDLVFNLLDVAMLHFVKACSNHSNAHTPPPSA